MSVRVGRRRWCRLARTGGNGADYVFHAGRSDDGTRVFIATAESLVSTDDRHVGGPV